MTGPSPLRLLSDYRRGDFFLATAERTLLGTGALATPDILFARKFNIPQSLELYDAIDDAIAAGHDGLSRTMAAHLDPLESDKEKTS